MSTLVSFDTEFGMVSRYECGGEAFRLTHRCYLPPEHEYDMPELIKWFRANPDPEFAVDPPPRPTKPPAGAGTIAVPLAA